MKNPCKNAPRLFGIKLNTMFRCNKYFIKKKKELFQNNGEKIKKFDQWLDDKVHEQLKTLEKYRELWTKRGSCEFKEVFAELSYIFFSKFAVRYVVNSKSRNKIILLRLIPQYLKGIDRPENFRRQEI